jgi:ABC-2 type transport system permease protein
MRVKAIMIRILLQLRHDKRTISLMIFAPILVLTLMAFIFDGSTYHPKIGIINAPISFVNKLENNDVNVIRYTENEAYYELSLSKIDAIIDFQNGVPHVTLEGSDPSKSSTIIKLTEGATQQLISTVKPDITYLYGYENMAAFDNFGPILISFFIFFFVFLIAGIAFLSERTSGTLERILATPLRRWEIVIGYILGFGVFTIIQASLISWFSINILNTMMIGSFALVLIITILTAMVALTIGMFISAFANNEMQMIQFIPLITVPQLFFSGLFDLSTMPPSLQLLGHFMPLWYSADALKNIMLRGNGWDKIAFDVLILMLIGIFFAIANTLVLKKYRKL